MLLHRYLAREVSVVFFITAPSLCLLLALFQTMRFLPLIAAPGITTGDVAELSLLILVPLAAVTLPAAMVVTIFLVLARLESDGEITALRALGASHIRIMTAPLVVSIVVSLSSGLLTLVAEPAVYQRLHERFGELLVRSTMGRIRPGVIVEPVPGLTVSVGDRRGNVLENVFIENRPGNDDEAPTQIFAATATLRPLGDTLQLRLNDGVIFSESGPRQLRKISFAELETRAHLSAKMEPQVTSVPERFGMNIKALDRASAAGGPEGRVASFLLHKRLSTVFASLGLCLVSLMLGLMRPISTKPFAVTLGAVLILTYHLLSRLGEALVDAVVVTPLTGGWMPVAATWVFLIFLWFAQRGSRARISLHV